MINKEERAELAALIEQAAMWPLPWQVCGDADSDALVFSADEAQEEYIAEFTGNYSCDLAVAAVNAAPKLLSALDAADAEIAALKARIAELEAAAQWRPIEEAPRDGTRIIMASKTNAYWPPRAFVYRERWVSRAFECTHEQAIEHSAVWLPIPALPEGGAK